MDRRNKGGREMAKQKNKFSLMTIILCAVLCLYVLSMLGLFYWGFITAFKKPQEFKFFDDPNTYKLPKIWYWNIIDAFNGLSMEAEAGKPPYPKKEGFAPFLTM